jgi:uncharacterized membrane protein YesL
MSDAVSERGGEFGGGPLSQAAALIYTLMVVEVGFFVTAAPGLVPLLLLDRDSSNLPLAGLCALPLGPAASATLYALHHRRSDLTDLAPVAAFWRGYRLNLRSSLGVWALFLVFGTIVAINLAHFNVAGVPLWWRGVLIGLAAAAILWVANALVIVSLFAFRLRDVARLATYFLVRRPVATFGTAALAIVALAITTLVSEALLVLLGSVFALAMLANARAMINEISREFTA